MTAPLAFILGLLTAFIICCSLAGWYYARARRRVKQIEKSIAEYQTAKNALDGALDKYAPTNTNEIPKRILSAKR